MKMLEMMSSGSIPQNLRIVLPPTTCSECLHTCSNSFRIIKRIGRGTHGHVYVALHVPTMVLYGVKRLRSGDGIELDTLKTELRALTDLCQYVPTDEHGEILNRQTTVLQCQQCCSERGYELIEGGIWVRKAAFDPAHAASNGIDQALHTSLCDNLFSMLSVKCPADPVPHKELSCPFLDHFIDSFPDNGGEGQCIILEYMRWGSLHDILVGGHKFTGDELAVIAYSVLRGLEYVSARGYTHRDVKPGNILMDAQGRVKLSDFGTASMAPRSTATAEERRKSLKASALLYGTLLYLPPEGFHVAHECTEKSDIWSFGVTLIHLLRGAHPFAHLQSYWELRAYIASATVQGMLPDDDRSSLCAPIYCYSSPQPLVDFLTRCIALDPSERSTAAELLQSPFIREAIATGAIQEEDPRLTDLAAELNTMAANKEDGELHSLADILKEECSEGDLQAGHRLQGMADQLGVSRDTLIEAVVASRNKPQNGGSSEEVAQRAHDREMFGTCGSEHATKRT